MRARCDINVGELLLCELVANAASVDDMISVLCEDPQLYNSLFPRLCSWSKATDQERISAARAKTHRNCFKRPMGHAASVIVLGKAVSMFNHSCKPNAFCRGLTDKTAQYSCIWAVNHIAAGQEVTITYNDSAGHDSTSSFNWTCNCGQTLDTRHRSMQVVHRIQKDFQSPWDLIDMHAAIIFFGSNCAAN